MQAIDISKKAETFKFLGDPTRLKILAVLFSTDEELCVNEISDAVDASPSATSHQLAKLEVRNIVTSIRDGQTMCYKVIDSSVTDELRAIINL